MTDKQIKNLAQTIRAEIEELVALSLQSKEARVPVALDQQSVGRLSRMDALQQQSMDLAREERRHARRDILEAALTRINDGEYGYCLTCGDEIPYERLKADPAATRCIDCVG